MIEADGMHFNRRWGYLSRAGVNDKSQLMRQIEKYAGETGCEAVLSEKEGVAGLSARPEVAGQEARG